MRYVDLVVRSNNIHVILFIIADTWLLRKYQILHIINQTRIVYGLVTALRDYCFSM